MPRAALSYQASYFANLEDYAPTAESIPPLLDAFREEEFLPTTFLQLHEGKRYTRLRLVPSNHEWLLDLDVHRITVRKNPVESWGANLGSIEQFAEAATDYISRVLAVHSAPGTRLALATKNLLDITQPDDLDAAYGKLVRPLRYYIDSSPHEWQTRSTARPVVSLEYREESLNVITTIGRTQGRFDSAEMSEEFDGISVDFDINTYQGLTQERFSASSLASFFEMAIGLRENLLTQIGDQLA